MSPITPFNPPLGPQPANAAFYSPEPTTLQMKEKILSLSGDQDDTYAKYIKPTWPDIRSLAIGQGGVGVGYGAFVFASAENAPISR